MSAEQFICASDALCNGGAGVRFSVFYHGREEAAFVVRYDGVVRAYLNRCAHIPVELDWTPGVFFDADGRYLICATHGALYAPESGRCIGGRCAGKSLLALKVVERDGQVFLMEHESDGYTRIEAP